MSKSGHFPYPAPLSISFHKWEDQCYPKLTYTQFCSIPWSGESESRLTPSLKKSEAWGDPFVSSVLMCGSECGVIVAYKIHSNEGKLIDICPLSLICAHSCCVVSIIRCDPLIYRVCCASLSIDGTLSIISVEDLTVVLNQPTMFSEGSVQLAAHESNPKMMLAIQPCGSIEVGDIYDGALIMTIAGFSSILNRIYSHGSLHSVSCIDGSLSVFTIVSEEMEPQCFFSVQNASVKDFSTSLLSPDLTYVLVFCPGKWALLDSQEPLFERTISNPADCFVHADWISCSRFYLYTLGGRVEIWEVDGFGDSQIFNRVKCVSAKFHATLLGETTSMTTLHIGETPETGPSKHGPPKLVHELQLQSEGIREPIIVTADGYIVTSPQSSCLKVYEPGGKQHKVSLYRYFKTKIRARCAIGDPVMYEARIGSDSNVYIGDFKNPIGEHEGAYMLYSPPIGSTVFSFSEDGSIMQWEAKPMGKSRKKGEYFDLSEAVARVIWIGNEGKNWMVCIGTESFCVIEPETRKSILLCSGHNSKIIDVVYADGLLHARCESSSIYSWNLDGQLVSKRKSKNLKRVGKINMALPRCRMARSEPVLYDQSNFDDGLGFYKVVSINIPNCQTFAVVFDVLEFLDSYNREKCEWLDIHDKSFLPLIMLWKKHIGADQVHLSKEGDESSNLLSSFDFAIAGDNFTVTLPISLKSQMRAKLRVKKNKSTTEVSRLLAQIPVSLKEEDIAKVLLDHEPQGKAVASSHIAFKFSSTLTSIHSIASSALGQCFVGVQNNENLSIIFALSQTATVCKLADAVQPSLLVLVNWLEAESMPLRQVIVSLLSELFQSKSTDECLEVLETVIHRFEDWEVILPVAFLAAKRMTLKESLKKDVVRHLFPALTTRPETLDLLSDVFDQFVKYIPSMSAFYGEVMKGLLSRKIPASMLMRFAWTSPLEFFDQASKTNKCPQLVKMMFQRYVDTDRKVLYQFLISVLRKWQKSTQFDSGKVFDVIAQRVVYVGNGNKFLVFGDEDGSLRLISKESAEVLWESKLSANPVTLVAVSPNSHRFLVLVEKDQALTWFSINSKKAKDKICEVIGSEKYKSKASPAVATWKDNQTVVLSTQSEQLQEVTAPKKSFFSFLK